MRADDAPFANAIAALRPRLADIVIIGGWAHRLHRLHSRAQSGGPAPLMTDDLDIAASDSLPISSPSLAELLEQAGFREDFDRGEQPPVTRWIKDSFKIEFVANLTGGLVKRGGRRDATALTGGVTAQRLRHIDLLLVEPWQIHLDHSTQPVISDTPADIRIANATAYVVQKLIATDRRPGDQAKDLLYVYDTLRTFADAFEELRTLWTTAIAPRLTDPERKKLRAKIDGLTEMNRIVVNAAGIARHAGRSAPPSAAEIGLACRTGLVEITG